jgi:putative ABC transport system substrate-binding protein
MGSITRRQLLRAVGGSLLAAPSVAMAQPAPGKRVHIGYLSPRSGLSYLDEAFREGLRELGYVEGDNVSLEFRWADWKPDRLAAFAAELVRLKPDVIVCTGGAATVLPVKRETTTIPIVFIVGDPILSGVATRLDRPGGNVTGISALTNELNPKRLELLKAAVPGVSRVAVLANPTNPPTARTLKDMEAAAKALHVTLQVLEARNQTGIDEAFVAMARKRAEAVLVMSDPMFFAERERIVELAAKRRLPGIFEWREFAEVGGLLSYGANIADQYRRLATYVDKILKGAKPGDLPIEQPTKFELAINLKTAKALRVAIPQPVLSRADFLIQ